jgi:hypothetical protein
MGIHMRGLGYKTEATARNSEKTLCQKQSKKLKEMRESKPPLLKHGYAKREYEHFLARISIKQYSLS